MRPGTIRTKNLDLVPYTPTDLLALINSPEEFQLSSGVPAAEGLREFLIGPEVSPTWIEMLRSSEEPDIWKHGFAVIDRKTGYVVGNAAFVGPPNNSGEVEIAYGVVPAFEGRGYATQACMALVRHALADGRVATVIAHTLPEKNASTRVLEKTGFSFRTEFDHPEDGTIWRWERSRD